MYDLTMNDWYTNSYLTKIQKYTNDCYGTKSHTDITEYTKESP